jgi:hypothetical protein
VSISIHGDVREHSLQNDDPWLTDCAGLEGTKHFRHASNCNTVDQGVLAQRSIRRRRRWW